MRRATNRWLSPAAGIAAVVLVLTSTACAPEPADAPVEGITVSVYQPRTDIAQGRIAIRVANESTQPFTITDANLSSTFFAEDLVWHSDRDVDMPPGRTVDLRVVLPESTCADPEQAEHSVTLAVEQGGSTRTQRFVPLDPFALFAALNDAACLVASVAEVAVLTSASLTPSAQPDAPATLAISVQPTGGDGAVVINSVQATTLLAPAEAGIGVPSLSLNVAITRDGPAVVTVPFVPNRCDAHALAEDKIGTRIPLTVTAPDGSTGRLVLAASDELRQQAYAFYASYCRLGT